MTDTNTPRARGAISIPEAKATFAPATPEEVDAAVETVRGTKDQWAALGVEARIALVDQLITSVNDLVDEWGRVHAEIVGLRPGSAYEGEEVSWGAYAAIRPLRMLRQTLVDIAKTGKPKLPGKPRALPDGQVAVPVFPGSWIDRAVFPMVTAELRLQRHVTLDTVAAGRNYTDPPAGRVCFVLGAGNNAAVPFRDVVQKLFFENQVCVLKMNPVNEALGPILRLAMAPLVREGYVRILHGGVEVGKQLTTHPGVDSLHITGSDKTHDAIVYGVGEEGERRKAADEPINDREFSTELGSISPVIVVPGEWSDEDLDYQAKHVHSMINANGGFSCGAMRVLITWKDWPQREQFLDRLRAAMAAAEDRVAYYPGARERWEAFTKAHPNAIWYGSDQGDAAPITMLPDLDPDVSDDIAFRCESFNGVFGELPMGGVDVAQYLQKAVDFTNDTLWGSLGATIIVHPKSRKDPLVDRAVERAVDDLEVGTVGVNLWALISYGLYATTWGAFPGHSRNDIQSGQGSSGNSFMVDAPEKTVIRAPWKLGKKPPGSYDWTTMGSLSRRLVKLEANRDPRQLPGIVLDGIKA